MSQFRPFYGSKQYTSLFTVYKCLIIWMSAYTNVRLYECPLIQMSPYTNVRIYECPLIQMLAYINVRLYECPPHHYHIHSIGDRPFIFASFLHCSRSSSSFFRVSSSLYGSPEDRCQCLSDNIIPRHNDESRSGF